MNWTEEQIQAVWNKGIIAMNNPKETWRKDMCGAWIHRDHHGKGGDIGWEVDHIFPESKAEDKGFSPELYDDLVNLQPLQHSNNSSKGDDYPKFKSKITSDGVKNIEKEQSCIIDENVQSELEKHFG